jgi:hypothetical protein
MDYIGLFEYRDGKLFWIKPTARHMKAGHPAGTMRKDGYIGVFLYGKYLFAHRIIWEMHNGPIPEGLVIDHIDTVRDNNRIDNLRVCTFQENHFNRNKGSNNKSGYKGVSWHKQKQKWVAQITIEGRSKFLGFFVDPVKAHEKYCEFAILHYGEYAKLD